MDINSQQESGKLEQIVSKFLLKILHIVLDSRIPSLHRHDRSGDLSSVSKVSKSDKWFNLVLGDRPTALDNLNFWHRNLMDPMVIDIILVHQNPNSSSMVDLYTTETVMERWVVQYESSRAMSPQTNESSTPYKKTYKKSIILLRSLYSFMRLLPAYRIFRQLRSLTQSYNFDVVYKVSSFSNPFSRKEEETMKEYIFVPVEAFPGRLCVSVTYLPTLSEFNLESSTSLPAMIITDYVPSPSTDPVRSSASSEKGVCATSFPSRGMRPPFSVPFERPHSWTSGFHKAAAFTQGQSVAGSPQAYRSSLMPYDYSSPSPDMHDLRLQNQRSSIHRKVTTYDEYQLSPPFSPSASPSPPTYLSGGNSMQTHMHSETAPVTIPLPVVGRGSRYLSPNFSDPNKHSLPPFSPRSWKHDPSPQESSSGNRSYRRSETLRAAELQSSVTNHYSGHKVNKDSRDDSGRFSGLLSSSGSPHVGFSRSSSRLSLQDDLDDCDFSCPFDVDDVETSDSPASQSQGKKKASGSPSQSLGMGRKSQDAAVGVLVHMLRTAPPLRQDSSCYSLRTEMEEGVGTSSSSFMPRRTVDALEELKSYRDMKDLLLSKSGTRLVSYQG